MANSPLLPYGPAELLERAIETLRARALPELKETPEHEAMLAAVHALAIAQAELSSDPAIMGRELAEIEGLLGRTFDGDAIAARRALADAIRARTLPSDGPTQVRLRDHLLKATANRLRLTNAKYMTRRQRRAESSY
ncbi:DUF6285 domain-containing protein [Dongia deserti]|uniref:DUF6285 domain-containing protein n=1 Tax=Dongia deserti TaxID=2268030 RepID=UPI000E65AFB5|nr:DUF6285 domain-containing protein [Dongia deserti]